jgi:MFS family permease
MKNYSNWLSKNLLGFGIASFFSDCSHEIVPLVLPALVTSLMGFEADPYYLGIISGVSTAAASITTLFSGWLSDRLANRKPLILLGYAVAGTFVGLIGLATSWLGVLILHAGAWIGRGLTSAPRNAIIADSTPPAYYGHAFGFRQAMDTAGAIAGPLIVYFLSGKSLTTIFYSTFIPGALAFFAILLLTKDIRSTPRSTQQLVPFAALPREFYLFLITLFIFGIGNFSRTLLLLRVQNSLTPLVGTVMALSISTVLYIFRNITQAGASYYIGALSDRVDRKLLLALFGFALFGCMCLALLWPSAHMLFLLFIFLLSGVSAGSYTTLEKSVAADLLPEHMRGTGYGILLTVDSIGDLFSSIIVGFLWTAFSAEIAFLYAAVLSFISAFILIAFPSRNLK